MKTVKLGDIATIYNGNSINKTVKKQKYMNDVPGWNYIGTKDVDFDGTITYDTGVIIPYTEERFKLAPSGSVFVCSEGGSAGKKTAIVKRDVCFGNKLFAIVNDKNLFDERYVYFYTRYEKFREQFKLLSTSLMGGISSKNFSTIEIPLPSKEEQERIVSRIGELFSEIDSAEKNLKTIKQQIDVYRHAVLKDVYRRIDKNEYKPFKEVMLGNPKNGLYKPKSEYGEGCRILRIDGFYDGFMLEQSSLKRLKVTEEELSNYSLSEGEIVVNRVNSIQYLGKCALIKELEEPTVFESNMMRIRLNREIIDGEFLTYYLSSLMGYKTLTKNAKHAVNQSSINQTDVRNAIVPVPQLRIQEKCLIEIKEKMSICDSVLRTVNESIQQTEVMRQSVLKEAFEGRL